MNVRIKIDEKDKVNGFYFLMTHYPINVYRNEIYVIPEEAIRELRKRKIKFEVMRK